MVGQNQQFTSSGLTSALASPLTRRFEVGQLGGAMSGPRSRRRQDIRTSRQHTPLPSPRPGSVGGEAAISFREVCRLAYGGMAEILLVSWTHSLPPRRVIKRILPHLRSHPACLRMFYAEAEMGMRLRHPNIIRTEGIVTDAFGPALLLEYVLGSDLARLLGSLARCRDRLSLNEAATLGQDIAAALAYAHTADGGGVIHRDVTPSNIMVTPAGNAKLIDFGVALNEDAETSLWPDCIKGKVAYMSPQQASGQALDARTDQYSLALVLWECMAGEPCFTQAGHFQLINRVARGDTRSIGEMRGGLPGAFVKALERALSLDPDRRFSSMEAFGEALAPFAGGRAGRGRLAQRLQQFPEDHHGRATAAPLATLLIQA